MSEALRAALVESSTTLPISTFFKAGDSFNGTPAKSFLKSIHQLAKTQLTHYCVVPVKKMKDTY
jgi:hypothetical protein